MSKQPIYIAFSTQKGGAGKTTLTVLVASYLHYMKGLDVAIIDCDYPQHSIAEMRERDLKMAMEDDYYNRMAEDLYTRLDRKAYPVVESSTERAIADAEYICEKEDFDIILFDLPGTVNNPSVITALANMDYIFAPIIADHLVLRSTLRYMVVVTDLIRKSGVSTIKDIYMFWNKVDGREKTELYDVYEKVISDLDFKVLKTFLPDKKRYSHEQSILHRPLFRSTLFPPERSLLRGSNLVELTDEILNIMKLENNG